MTTRALMKGEGRILIVGAARPERWAAEILRREGFDVEVCDTPLARTNDPRDRALFSPTRNVSSVDIAAPDSGISMILCGCRRASAASASPLATTDLAGATPANASSLAGNDANGSGVHPAGVRAGDPLFLARSLREANPWTELVLLCDGAPPDDAFEVADEVVEASSAERLLRVTEHAYERRMLRIENGRLRTALADASNEHDLVAVSPGMRRLRDQATLVARSLTVALVSGEPGTGKEVLASFLHHMGPRRAGPFLRVSCAALSDEMFLEDLFGAAAFGAVDSQPGRIDLARGGTLFVEGVEEMSLPVQLRLLASIEAHAGADYPHIIASASIELDAAVARGEFDPRLYERLSSVSLRLPPLRERRDDIHVLASRFCAHLAERHAKQVQGITPGALHRLVQHAWPGNVRELENIIERAVILCRGLTLTEDDLPEPLLAASTGNEVRIPIGTSMEEAQSMLIRATLSFTSGNKERAARLLGIASRTIHRRVGPNRPRQRVDVLPGEDRDQRREDPAGR